MTGAELLIVGLSVAALALVVAELVERRRYLVAWAVGLLAVAELVRALVA
jgi:hypothetical protein